MRRTYRMRDGRYMSNYHKQLYPLKVLISSMILCLVISGIGRFFPYEGEAKALPTTEQVAVPEPTPTASPSPTATPKPEPTPKPETPKQEIIDLIVEVFGEDAPDAFNVLFCENRNLNPNATNHNNNGTIDRGLFQINSIHGGEEMFDPETNVKKAKAIFDKQGWRPWTCAHRVGQKNYLNQ